MEGSSKKRRRTSTSDPKPRRTHKLGGCLTCRRRHVKCDQEQPACRRCQNSKVVCGGYPPQIRWASVSTSAKSAQKDAQKPKETVWSSGSPLSVHRKQLVGTENIEPSALVRTELAQAEETASDNVLLLQNNTDDVLLANEDLPAAPVPVQDLDLGPLVNTDHCSSQSLASISDLDSFFDSSGVLGWKDLFDGAFEFSSAPLQDGIYDNPLDLLAHAANPSTQALQHERWSNISPQNDRHSQSPWTVPPEVRPPSCARQQVTEEDVLDDAQQLLKHFRDAVLPHLGPAPMSSVSPWESIIWSAAIHTLAEMTFLHGQNVKHAHKANMFALVAYAAHHRSVTKSSHDIIQSERDGQVLDFAAKAAKQHLQTSLRHETSGSNPAKYKDQLMAIFALILLATRTGKDKDARCYMIDAERLLRLRGLAKQDFSRRARLLHHIYSWSRIIGESTFMLQTPDKVRIDKMIESSMRVSDMERRSSRNIQLDDFLRVGPTVTDTSSDPEGNKYVDSRLRDIHHEDLRPWPRSLYVEIYGIPELWLALLSQVTRLANIMEFISKQPSHAGSAFAKRLHRRVDRLEDMVCSFAAQQNSSEIQSPSTTLPNAELPVPPTAPLAAMLRALSSALVILFYRRIRQVHPWILQGHVGAVIAALRDYETALEAEDQQDHPGTPWPAFMAGCEAMSARDREWVIKWMQRGSKRAAAHCFTASQQVMREVWRRNDAARGTIENQGEARHGQSELSQKPGICSWVDVLRAGNSWLMLY